MYQQQVSSTLFSVSQCTSMHLMIGVVSTASEFNTEKGESSPKFKDFDADFASCWFRSLTSMPLMSDVGRILTVCEYKRVDEEEGDGGKLEVGIKSFLSSNENIKYYKVGRCLARYSPRRSQQYNTMQHHTIQCNDMQDYAIS